MRRQRLSNRVGQLARRTSRFGAPAFQPVSDRALVSLVARLVEALVHAIGQVALGGVSAVVVVGVLVPLAVAQALGAGKRRVAQVQRHLGVGAGFDGRLRAPERGRGAVALRRRGQVGGGVGERKLRFRQADALHGFGRRGGDQQALRVGVAHVFGGENDHPPGDKARVFAGGQHLGQVEDGGVGIGAAQALDEGGDGLIVVVAQLVVAHLAALGRFAHVLGGDDYSLSLWERVGVRAPY